MQLKDMKVLLLSPEEARQLEPSTFHRADLRANVSRADLVLVVASDGFIIQILRSRHFAAPASEPPQGWIAPVLSLVPSSKEKGDDDKS